MNGILIIDKPAGMTSAEVVRRVSRRVPTKVGHLGTLDPFATGVLPLCLGDGTKIAQFLSAADKTYAGLIQLGTATDTGDPTGSVVRTALVPAVERPRLDHVERRFLGTYEQVPPMYSALKRDGVPLYKLARQGVEVEREPRAVRIDALRLVPENGDCLRFEVSCSKGTYVRVLAEDIAAELGTVAHLRTLRRLRFGPFSLTQAVTLDAWVEDESAGLLPVAAALQHLPRVLLGAEDALAVGRGQVSLLGRLARDGRLVGEEPVVLMGPEERVLAVCTRRAGRWAFARVLTGGSFTSQEPCVNQNG